MFYLCIAAIDDFIISPEVFLQEWQRIQSNAVQLILAEIDKLPAMGPVIPTPSVGSSDLRQGQPSPGTHSGTDDESPAGAQSETDDESPAEGVAVQQD